MSASLLTAIGLPELITHSLEAYATLAFELASDRARYERVRQKLEANRSTHPLFDTGRFTRDLEAAYSLMFERRRQGLAPQDLEVPSAVV
jgi:predicted O-linked N-acetylglucosamine transferase (SPINDLY family)